MGAISAFRHFGYVTKFVHCFECFLVLSFYFSFPYFSFTVFLRTCFTLWGFSLKSMFMTIYVRIFGNRSKTKMTPILMFHSVHIIEGRIRKGGEGLKMMGFDFLILDIHWDSRIWRGSESIILSSYLVGLNIILEIHN